MSAPTGYHAAKPVSDELGLGEVSVTVGETDGERVFRVGGGHIGGDTDNRLARAARAFHQRVQIVMVAPGWRASRRVDTGARL